MGQHHRGAGYLRWILVILINVVPVTSVCHAQNTGSCDFSGGDKCGYTIPQHWTVQNGPYKGAFFGKDALPGGHTSSGSVDAHYALYNPLHDGEFNMTSPRLAQSTSCVSFWYIVSGSKSYLSVLTMADHEIVPHMLWNVTGGVKKQWTRLSLTLNMRMPFKIVFRTKATGWESVGVDDIQVGSSTVPTTKTTPTTQKWTTPTTRKWTTPTTRTWTTPTTRKWTTPTTRTTTTQTTRKRTKPTTRKTTTPTTQKWTTPTTRKWTTPTTRTMTTPTTGTTTTPTTRKWTTPTTRTTTTPTTRKWTTPTTREWTTPTTRKWTIPTTRTTTTPTTRKWTTPTTRKTTTPTMPLTTRETYVWTKSTTQEETTSNPAVPGITLEDAVHVGCNTIGWDIKLHLPMLRQLYTNLRPSDVYLGDNSCMGVERGDILLFQQGLRQCLTSERVSGSSLMYTNDLIYAVHDPMRPFIIRQFKWTFTVECDIQRNESASAHLHHNQPTDVEHHHGAVTGHYNVSLAFYSDVNFMREIPGNPVKVNVGDDVYVKVFTPALDWTVKMRVHTCYTKPAENAPDHMKYYLIKDGCETDSNTHIISQYPHETKFVFREFEYSTNHEGLNVYCDATFCDGSDFSPACIQTCAPNAISGP